MPLSAGDRLGPYEVIGRLGAGGMGDVYRARDTRLGRAVAIKVLRDGASSSVQHRQRFEREARAIATLNHPNICTLHDVGRSGELDYLVMELVEGETLAERLKRGPLSTPDVIRYGTDIAHALARAHRAGVLHRDLKPGNVMLSKTGAKLMDFGLARLAPRPGVVDTTAASTASAPITGEGNIVGTYNYMAPELLEGREADVRSDIWALGATLYEMVTARRAFEGTSTASLIGSIMNAEPRSIGELVPLSPPMLDRLVKTCLAKDPEARWQSAADLARELPWAGQSQVEHRPAEQRGARRLRAPIIALVLLLGLAVMIALLRGPGRSSSARPVQSSMSFPMSALDYMPGSFLALSPDGSSIAIAYPDSTGTWRLYRRDLAASAPDPLETPHGARLPFWSPDSREIAYATEESKLVRVLATGGPERTICDAPDFLGGTWGPNGEIVFSGGPGRARLYRVRAAGGIPTLLAAADSAAHEGGFTLPCFLPDGNHVIAAVSYPAASHLVRNRVFPLRGGPSHDLMDAQGAARIASDGTIVFVRDRALICQKVSRDGGRLLGEPVVLPVTPERKTYLSIADAGAALAPGVIAVPSRDERRIRYQWFDRRGTPGPAIANIDPAFVSGEPSPDGKRAIVKFAAGLETSIWSLDLNSGGVTRLTPPPWRSRQPCWEADSRHIVFEYYEASGHRIWEMDVEDPASARPLFETPRGTPPTAQLGLGEAVLLNQPGTSLDVAIAERAAGWKVRPYLNSSADEWDATFYDHGRFVLYAAAVTDRTSILADEFRSHEHRNILTHEAVGHAEAVTQRSFWTAGQELIYLAEDERTLRAAKLVITPDGLEAGPAVTLFTLPADLRGVSPTADGTRFLLATPVGPRQLPSVTLLQNWDRARDAK